MANGFTELMEAARICERNSAEGSADERQAWSGMAERIRLIAQRCRTALSRPANGKEQG